MEGQDSSGSEEPREYTREEVMYLFLENVRQGIVYWEHEARAETSLKKLNGLAHYILALIDGEGNLPKMILAPDPELPNKEDAIERGDNYFPENFQADVESNIGGDLHNEFESYKVK